MTAETLRANVLRRIDEARERHIQALRRCKYQPAVIHKEGAVVPPSSVEQIALYANQTNASIEMLDGISLIINEEFRKLTQPETPQEKKPKPKELY